MPAVVLPAAPYLYDLDDGPHGRHDGECNYTDFQIGKGLSGGKAHGAGELLNMGNRLILTGDVLSRTITGMTYLYSLCLLILALWLASEIVARDLSSPAPKDPYRLDRWRKGERDPDQ